MEWTPFLFGVTMIGHTQETTEYSALEALFERGVSLVNIPERGHTQESTA